MTRRESNVNNGPYFAHKPKKTASVRNSQGNQWQVMALSLIDVMTKQL